MPLTLVKNIIHSYTFSLNLFTDISQCVYIFWPLTPCWIALSESSIGTSRYIEIDVSQMNFIFFPRLVFLLGFSDLNWQCHHLLMSPKLKLLNFPWAATLTFHISCLPFPFSLSMVTASAFPRLALFISAPFISFISISSLQVKVKIIVHLCKYS